MAAAKGTPKDIQVMASVLRDVGVTDYEPKVLNQMLEFSYRFVTSILEDAQKISLHAKKKTIDKYDVVLALAIHLDKNFVSPPPREALLEYSEGKNGIALPLIKSTAGPRLPPDRYSLTACNYRLKSNKKKAPVSSCRSNLPFFPPSSAVNKMNSIATLSNKNNPMMSPVLKQAPTISSISKPSIASIPTITSIKPPLPPTPIIKLTEGNRSITPTPIPSVIPLLPNQTPPMPTVVIKSDLPIMNSNNGGGIKRKREDDEENINFDT